MFPPKKKPPGPPTAAPAPPPMPPGAGPSMQGAPPLLQAIGGGSPIPGQGADPMQAMMGMLGPGQMGAPPPPPMGGAMDPGMGYPADPQGMPFGSSMPDPDGDGDSGDMAASPLLQAIMGGMGGDDQGDGMGGVMTDPSDPYGVMPGEPNHVFDDAGTGDPQMGMEQLLQMIAMAKMGIGGDPTGMGGGPPMGGMPPMM